MAIPGDLEAFLQEHRRCGELTSGIRDTPHTDPIIWMDCSCGGRMSKPIVKSHENVSQAEDLA